MSEILTNTTILDKVRLSGTNDYQQRIPQASQVGVERTMRALQSPLNNDLFNEFAGQLINLIGNQVIRSKEWMNPLAKFKRINSNQSQSIQEIGFELVRAKGFDPKAQTLFDVHEMENKVAYHSRNRTDMYPMSVNDTYLMRSFLTPAGLSSFVAAAIQTLTTSDNNDEYRLMLQLISSYHENYTFYNVQVPDIAASTAQESDVKLFLEKVRATTGKLKFLSSAYNGYGIPTFTMPENSLLITTPDIAAKIDVQVLSAAFNVSFAEMQNKVIIVDAIPIPGCYALLVDEDWFVCADTLYTTTSFYNPETLTTNYYLHHHGILSVSPLMNAIMFSKDPDTNVPVITFTPTDYSIALANGFTNISLTGENILVGDLAGTVIPANSEIASDFTPSIFEVVSIVKPAIAGDATSVEQIIPLTIRTYVDVQGVLHLQADVEVGDVITIKGDTTYNSGGVGESVFVTETVEFAVVA